MARIEPIDLDHAPAKARELLDEYAARAGEPGPMVRTMANAPALLRGYLDLNRAMKRSHLDRRITDLLVNAFYRGGSSVIDFSDPTAPKEIAFADLDGTNTWSAYTYPRKSRRRSSIPVYSNDGLSRNYGTAANPNYPEAAYGFQRFHADVGRTTLVGFDRLNPPLQERAIATKIARPKATQAKPRTYAKGTPAPKGARNRSARPFEK